MEPLLKALQAYVELEFDEGNVYPVCETQGTGLNIYVIDLNGNFYTYDSLEIVFKGIKYLHERDKWEVA